MALFSRVRGRSYSLRRIGTVGGVLALVLGLGAYHLLGGHKPPVVKVSASRLPQTDATPGGDHATPYIRKVTDDEIRRKAHQAERAHVSATADLPPATQAEPTPAQVTLPQPVTPGPQTIPTRYDPPATTTSVSPTLNVARYNAYTKALAALQGQMPSPSYATHVYEKSDPPTQALAGADPTALRRDAGGPRPPTAVPMAASMAPRMAPPETVLIPADHGVYGRTLTGVSSDQSNATVIVQAESGPIAGDRMSGHFATEGDRLVVKLTELSLDDGRQVAIDAVVVAPDSMDEAVATGVDHHYATRFILPIAAAFVEGLGQAIETANSVVQESALGGITQYNHLNLGQSLGVAAGTAGQTAGQLIQQAAQHGPTVTLASYADVGVLFLKPVKVPEGVH